MNYITQLNGFFGCLDKELSLTPNSVSLYLALLHINNTKDWVKEFVVKNSYIEKLIGIHRVKLDEARNKLKQAGLITYVKSTGNLIGTYSVIEFGKDGKLLKNHEAVTQSGTQRITQSVTQTGTETVTQLGTQNETLPININKLKLKPKRIKQFVRPTVEEIRAYCQERKNNIDPQKFFDFFNESDWYDSKGNPVQNWKQKIITWEGGRSANGNGSGNIVGSADGSSGGTGKKNYGIQL